MTKLKSPFPRLIDSVPEGTPAKFALESVVGVTSNPIDVHISVTDPGSFLKWRVPKIFKMNTTPYMISLETQNDEIVVNQENGYNYPDRC